METPISSFGFSNIIITRSLIEQDLSKRQGKQVKIDIKPDAKFFKSQHRFQLQLDVNIHDDNNRFASNIITIGFFPTENLSEDNDIFTYLYTNAPALMFPYIRAFISTLTAQSGLETVIIPPANLTGLGLAIKESLEIID